MADGNLFFAVYASFYFCSEMRLSARVGERLVEELRVWMCALHGEWREFSMGMSNKNSGFYFALGFLKDTQPSILG